MTETKDVLALAVETGDLLLRNGAEVYRVEDTIIRILAAYDIEDYDVYVLSNGIFASANEDRPDACSVIRHIPLGSTHLGRIAALNQLSREICSHRCSVEEAWGRLEECRTIPQSRRALRILCCGTASAFFAYLFGGTLVDAAAALAVGMVLQVWQDLLKERKVSKVLTDILSSAAVTLMALLLYLAGLPVHYDKIIIGGIMPLVPGISFTTSIRDFFNGDYLCGTIHLIDAVITAVCIAAGVGAVITLCRVLAGGIAL